jgi:hypothetical protein
LDKHGLRKKIIVYVKDKGFNFNAMTTILKFIVSCESLILEESFQGTYFEHFFFKGMSIWYNRRKVCKTLKYVAIKFA